MKGIVQDEYGSADVLEFRDIEEPAVGEGDVLVRVRAAGCGPDVWHLMTGRPLFVRLMPGFHKMRNGVRGRDAAGIVEAVGSKVTGFSAGDEVMGIAEGSFAELAPAPVGKLVPKPARLSFEEAAAAPISGLTALQAIRDVSKVQPGQRVLVIGAGGGVGTLTVQVAKAFGAHVTGVAGTSKLDLVRQVGADDAIDYTKEDFTDGSRRWDVIVDTAGRRPLRELRRALTPKGTVAIVGGEGGGAFTGGFLGMMVRAPVLSLFTGQKFRMVVSKETPEDLRALAELIEAGTVTPVVGKTFPLVDAAEALREIEGGHARGKIIVTV
ncbi:MAG TPA: NAD(P)-dependent alcohol dehydrogenase [Actinomycetota bacterium]|nr:NAD(P)-dependent alcohol dehydrogenase [Actinomycetota bacterium]